MISDEKRDAILNHLERGFKLVSVIMPYEEWRISKSSIRQYVAENETVINWRGFPLVERQRKTGEMVNLSVVVRQNKHDTKF